MDALILGQRGGTNIGESFYRAAYKLKLKAEILDTNAAYQGPLWLKRITWHLFDKQPLKRGRFERRLIALCNESKPKVVITTGIAPVGKECLLVLKKKFPKTKWVNYLTDDPWNRVHYCNWFVKAVPFYDYVFNPRKSNIQQLKALGCKNVEFLPFGYDHELFFPEKISNAENETYGSDVLFVGCADSERVGYIEDIASQPIKFKLYGDYWKKIKKTQSAYCGYADIPTMRKAISCAKVVLCLVRRANRDGNSMRSFEVPAVGACMLMEDTSEHREIFGEDGENVAYFSTKREMLSQIKRLIEDDDLRAQLKNRSHQVVIEGKHSYVDRLSSILATVL